MSLCIDCRCVSDYGISRTYPFQESLNNVILMFGKCMHDNIMTPWTTVTVTTFASFNDISPIIMIMLQVLVEF